MDREGTWCSKLSHLWDHWWYLWKTKPTPMYKVREQYAVSVPKNRVFTPFAGAKTGNTVQNRKISPIGNTDNLW